MISPFGIDLYTRCRLRPFRNDIDDAADGIGAIFGTGSAADDFDAFDIFAPIRMSSSPLPLYLLTSPRTGWTSTIIRV